MKLSLTKWTQNKNSVSVNYGPLTFSLKIDEHYQKINSKESATEDSKWQSSADQAKWPAYNIYPASMWNYGLALDDQSLSQQFELIKKPWPYHTIIESKPVPFSRITDSGAPVQAGWLVHLFDKRGQSQPAPLRARVIDD